MKSSEQACLIAREGLSARRDGEPHDARALDEHVALCPACRQHERTLARISDAFEILREPSSLPDLWSQIELRARPRRSTPLRVRIAAALVGFVGLGGTFLFLQDRSPLPPARPHLLERLVRPLESETFLASAPELRLLRSLTSATARQGSDSR